MKKVYIAAGGTGGHINAAISLGEVLKDNYDVTYLTGTRYLDYQLFKDEKAIHLASAPLRSKNPIKILSSILKNTIIFLKILILYLKEKPCFVAGAGGYVCGPTLIAAKLLFKPIFIIEQNAIMGLTNKILARFSDLVFTNFHITKGIKESSKVLCLGNPIRSSIKESKNTIENEVKVLVFGGSLGATQINQIIKDMIKEEFEAKVHIIHQVGLGNIEKNITKIDNIRYEQYEYLDDMNKYYEWSNIVISRAGASTISELRVVKRPAILIPYPLATDNHQYFNAVELKSEKLSYVKVIDNMKHSSLVAKEIKNLIVEFSQNSGKYLVIKEVNIENVALKIKKEIEKYVWN